MDYLGYGDGTNFTTGGASSAYATANYCLYPKTSLFTCPGSGNQIIKELSAYVNYYGAANIRLAVYSADGDTLIAEGSSQVAVSGGPSWQGHMAQGDITPNPAVLTGGTEYRVVVNLDANTYIYYDAGSSGDGFYVGYVDYTNTGFPEPMPAVTSYTRKYSVRCGVEPETPGVIPLKHPFLRPFCGPLGRF